MEQIYFEAQLCSEIATLKDKSKKQLKMPKIVWLVESFEWNHSMVVRQLGHGCPCLKVRIMHSARLEGVAMGRADHLQRRPQQEREGDA